MSERLQWLGRLEEKRQEVNRLKLKLDANRSAIRLRLDPFGNLEEIDGEAVAELALQFSGELIAYKAILQEMKAIDKALGR